MIKTIQIVILAVAFFGLVSGGIAQTKASSKDEEAIRSLIMERIESFNNKHEAPQSIAFTHVAIVRHAFVEIVRDEMKRSSSRFAPVHEMMCTLS